MVYLIPCELYEGVVHTIPNYVIEAIKECDIFFVENERTSRRFLKRVWKDMVIDDYEWVSIHKTEPQVISNFEKACHSKKNIGIISEAGCPGVADPGQLLVAKAQEMGVKVVPLVGPSSILLSLMASGLNGQSFTFCGYLPIEANQRKMTIQKMEEEIRKSGTTQIFIETPYRNDTLLALLLNACKANTRLCIAAAITNPETEWIQTKTINEWKKVQLPKLHKMPVIFLLGL